MLTGWEVYHAMLDPRDSTLYAATQSYAYGALGDESTVRIVAAIAGG